MMELLTKVLEFCVENNCVFEFNPVYSVVDVTVKGLSTSWMWVSVSFKVENGCVEDVNLSRRDDDNEAQYLHDIPCSDIMTFLADVVARYQL